MRAQVATALLIGWLLGVSCGALGIAAVGDEHYWVVPSEFDTIRDRVNRDGWEVTQSVSHPDGRHWVQLRRPRVRLLR
jgi:hypothetical protein